MFVDLQLLPYHHKKSEIPDSSFLLAIMSPPTQTEFVYFFLLFLSFDGDSKCVLILNFHLKF